MTHDARTTPTNARTTPTTPSPYRAFLTAVRNAVRGAVVDTVELRSAFDERAPVAFVAGRILEGRSVLFADSPLDTTPDTSPLPRGW